MNKLVMKMIILGVTLTIISTLNSLLLVGESQKTDSNSSFLTYNDTAYGISINYPSNWQIDKSANEYLLAILQNITSESQGANDNQNNAIKSKVSEILDAFGLGSVSDVVGLSPDKRTEVLQLISQRLDEGGSHVIVMIMSPPEDDSDAFLENLNIVVGNISTASPISLNDYVNANIEGLKIVIKNFTIIQPPTEITINGNPAMTFVYTGRNPVDDSFYGKYLNVFAMNGNTDYVLTFTSPPETYSRYEPTFEKMLQSFRIN